MCGGCGGCVWWACVGVWVILYLMYIRMYRMAGNFGGKIFWRIAENMSFGGIYFGG